MAYNHTAKIEHAGPCRNQQYGRGKGSERFPRADTKQSARKARRKLGRLLVAQQLEESWGDQVGAR